MRYYLILCVILSLYPFGANMAINKSKPNGVHLELFGQGAFYSIAFERYLISKQNYSLSGQVGCSYNFNISSVRDFFLPITLNIQIPNNTHNLECGIGVIGFYNTIPEKKFIESGAHITGRIGYRFSPTNSSWNIRIGFTPVLDLTFPKSPKLEPWGGLSVGYMF